MMHRGFLASLWVCIILPAWGQSYEDNESLARRTQSFLEAQLADEYIGVPPENVKVTVSSLDSRVRLTLCDDAIKQAITSPRPYGVNISVKTQCTGSKPWTIYVPAKIETAAMVAVLSKSLNRGDVIGGDDVELTLMNTIQAGHGYIGELDRVIGMELKRRLGTGEAIRLSHITTPEIVHKGEKVVLEASISGVVVVTNAKALTSGRLGEQIQVENIKSNRVVEGKVVAPGRVRVTL